MAKGRRQRRGPAPTSRGIAAVILAAGASRRLGQCKALVDLDGETPLSRLASAARELSNSKDESGTPPPLVVVGPHEQEIAAQLPPGCELLPNDNAQAGRTGGLQLAIARRRGFDLAVLPVDVPRVPGAVLRALAEAWRAQGSPPMGWLAPRYQGQFGHPILIGSALAERLARFPADRPLSELRAYADPLFSLECEAHEILEDLDTPSDLANLRALLAKHEDSLERESE